LLSAGNSFNATAGSVTAGADAALTAGQDISLGAVTAGNNATLTATAGDINLGTVTAAAGNATLNAGQSINAAAGSVTAGMDAALTAGQDISLGTVTAGNNATLTAAAGDINLGAVTATAGDATLSAGHSINAATGTVAAGTDAALTAGQDISLGVVTAGNDASLTAGEDINLGAAGSITAGNAATLTAESRDINLLGTVTAPTVTATANRNISGGGTVTANLMQLTAVTGAIGATGDDLNLQLNSIAGATPQLTAAARYDSNLNITAVSFDGIAPVKNDEPVGGDASLYADFNDLLAGGNLNLTLNPGLASGQPVNAWYEIPANGIAVAGGAMNIQLTSPAHDADAVTLDVDGLLASGFDGIQYTVDPTGDWSTVLTVAGRSFQAPINFAAIAGGVIHLDNINTAEGGVVSITGNGQLAEAEHIQAARGPAFVDILNQDAGLTLEANDIALGYGRGGFDLQRYSHHDGTGITLLREWGHNASSDDSNEKGHGWAWAWGWDNGNAYGHDRRQGVPQLTLQSATGISLMGVVSTPLGESDISAQGDNTGSGLTVSKWINFTAAGGAIGTSVQPLNLGITPGGLLNAAAAGDINLNAPAGDGPVGVIATPGNISLSAPAGSIFSGLKVDDGFDGGQDHDKDDVPVNNFSGTNITLSAGGSIGDEHDPVLGAGSGVWNITAGEGVALVSNGGFNAGSLTTTAGAVHLWANGDTSIASFAAPFAFLDVNLPGGRLSLGDAAIGTSLDADADNIAISNLTHADPIAPLHLSLQGHRDGMAQSIQATITSGAPVLVDEYASQTGSLRLSGDWLYLDHATVGQSASFSNNWLQLDFSNVDRHQHPQMLHLDLAGDQFSSRAGQLDFSLLKLQPGASFTMPSDPSPTQRMMMKELHSRGR
jgi:filamentous hemagglutinin